MKLSSSNAGVRLLALSLLATTLVVGCGGGKKTDPAGGGTTATSGAITTEDKFKVGAGADPAVSDSMGGNGFEKIAAAQGWQTGTLTDEQFKLIADANAKKGGQFTLALSEFPATLRTMGKDENSSTTRTINNMVYEGLIGVNPLTLEFLPALASHWKVDPDMQTYWFRIDPNARFSDGHRVTTEDVLATFDLGMDETILSPYTNSFFQGFDRPEAISPYILKVRSKTKAWKNMLYFGGQTVLPAHYIKGLKGGDYLKKFQYEQVPGTGPYIVQPKDVVNGKSITITRRANYWAQDYPINKGVNNFDKIKIVVVRDERLMLEKFKKGEIDFYAISRAQWWKEEFDFDEIKRGIVQKRRIFNDNPVGVGGFVFNMRKPPFNDPKVREAFILLFNREQMLEKIMYNQYIINDSYYPNSVYENPNNPKYRYNPERAAQLLAEAGYTSRNSDGILVKDGKPFVIEMGITEGLDRIVTPVQQDLKKAGIQLNLQNVESVKNFKDMNERNFTISWINWGGLLYPNPISSFHSKLADVPNTNNLSGFKNTRADQIMDEEQVTFDQAKRVAMLRELDSILMESKQYALSWYAPYVRIAYWNKFGHPAFYLGKISDADAILSTWWFEPEKEAEMTKGRTDKSVKMEVGETDVKFWPDYNKAHPAGQQPAAQQPATGTTSTDTGSKAQPSIK